MRHYPVTPHSRHSYGCAPVQSPETLPARRSSLTSTQRAAKYALLALLGAALGGVFMWLLTVAADASI